MLGSFQLTPSYIQLFDIKSLQCTSGDWYTFLEIELYNFSPICEMRTKGLFLDYGITYWSSHQYCV